VRYEQVRYGETKGKAQDNANSKLPLAIHWDQLRGSASRVIQSEQFIQHDMCRHQSLNRNGSFNPNTTNIQISGYGRSDI
jgi:hypothetical protein